MIYVSMEFWWHASFSLSVLGESRIDGAPGEHDCMFIYLLPSLCIGRARDNVFSLRELWSENGLMDASCDSSIIGSALACSQGTTECEINTAT
jgi:hypothetical protein